MNELIFAIEVIIDDYLEVKGHSKQIGMALFHGNVKSDLFTGIILPGAVDVQETKSGEAKTLSARYMLEGTDNTGAPCKIFIENYATDGEDITTPHITTNSESLSYLENEKLSGRIIAKDGKLIIEIYK